jgi:AcrR family transcriptional regulator
MKSEMTKDRIILQTTELIRASNGDTKSISIRRIAERSGVGVGLINHYFGSKDHLIEVCVERIITGVIASFRPEKRDADMPAENLKRVAKQVMDFLMDNREISRVSILSDCLSPKVMDNTMRTVLGFGHVLSGGQASRAEREKAFVLTAALQAAFLRKDTLEESLGVDLNDKTQRDGYIDRLVGGMDWHEIPDSQREPQ